MRHPYNIFTIMPEETSAVPAQYLRLLITLSSGALILVAAFLRDVFRSPIARPILGIAIGAFALCVLFSARAYMALLSGEVAKLIALHAIPEIEQAKPGTANRVALDFMTRHMWAFRYASYSFFAGVAALAVFIIWNLMLIR